MTGGYMRVLPQADNVLSVAPQACLIERKAALPSRSEIYQPSSKAPLKGTTELTKEERHTMHLRKKRLRRAQSKNQTACVAAVARLDKKTHRRVERNEAMTFLSRQRNVTITPSANSSKRKKAQPERKKS